MITPAQLEELAKRAHEKYLHTAPTPGRVEPARCDWSILDEAFREQNRDQVRDQISELRRLGYAVVPVAAAAENGRFEIKDHLDELARREHARWMVMMIERGYIYGAERDDTGPPRTHPDMVPWVELCEEAKQKDRLPWLTFLDHLLGLSLTAVSAAALARPRIAPELESSA